MQVTVTSVCTTLTHEPTSLYTEFHKIHGKRFLDYEKVAFAALKKLVLTEFVVIFFLRQNLLPCPFAPLRVSPKTPKAWGFGGRNLTPPLAKHPVRINSTVLSSHFGASFGYATRRLGGAEGKVTKSVRSRKKSTPHVLKHGECKIPNLR